MRRTHVDRFQAKEAQAGPHAAKIHESTTRKQASETLIKIVLPFIEASIRDRQQQEEPPFRSTLVRQESKTLPPAGPHDEQQESATLTTTQRTKNISHNRRTR